MKVYNYLGYEILAGRNSRENDKLVLTSNNTDIWFHVKDAPGRHVVVKSDSGEVPMKVLKYAAGIASGGERIDVIYSRIINVSKNKYSKSGEVQVEEYDII